MDKFESNPITFPSINLYDVPEESIDYIFATGYTDIINSYVIRDFNPNLNNDPVEFGSDHLPVVTILTFWMENNNKRKKFFLFTFYRLFP